MAIIAALIGAAAVVVGVFLAQWLADARGEALRRGVLARSLKNLLPEFLAYLRELPSKASPKTPVEIIDLLNEIEAACSHMSKWRRTRLLALLDELFIIVATLPGRVQAQGVLSDDDERGLGFWIAALTLSLDSSRPVDREETLALLNWYSANGPLSSRPGAPHLGPVPPSRWTSLWRSMLKRITRRPSQRKPDSP